MQIRKVAYSDFFNASVVTPAMVQQLALGLGMSQAAIDKLAKQQLAKASGGRGGRTNGAGDCPDAKLRTVVLNKLQHENDLVSNFTHGVVFEYEFNGPDFPDETPEPDINAAGQNNARKQRAPKQGGNGAVQQGAYRVVKTNGLKCTAESDPEKFALWQILFSCNTFEEYYAKAPKKAVTRTQRIITAASEMGWALKSGWVVPVSNEA